MKILVLGSNSFAGGMFSLTAAKSGMEVHGVSRSKHIPRFLNPITTDLLASDRFNFHNININNDLDQLFDLTNKIEPSYIVDFAGQGMVAESWSNPHQWYQTNLVSKVKWIDFLLDKKWLKKYIRISTPEVYGSTDELTMESDLYNPSTPYAVSHAAIDMHLKAYVEQHGFPAIIGRFSNFYGPTQQLYRIIPKTIIYARLGKRLPLHGGGMSTRAFIFGKDVASGIMQMLDSAKTGSYYHFSTNEFIRIRDLVQLIHSKMGLDFDRMIIETADRPGKDVNYFMSDTKARQELNWAPKTSLSEGIDRTIEWIDLYWNEIKNSSFEYEHKE